MDFHYCRKKGLPEGVKKGSVGRMVHIPYTSIWLLRDRVYCVVYFLKAVDAHDSDTPVYELQYRNKAGKRMREFAKGYDDIFYLWENANASKEEEGSK